MTTINKELTPIEKKEIDDFISELANRKNLTLKEFTKQCKDFITINIDKSWPKTKKKKWTLYLSAKIKSENAKYQNVSKD